MRLYISPHAIERFRERHGECDELDERRVRFLLREQLERGVPYGAQRGSNQLQLLPCGLVAAVEFSNGVMVVKTVLTLPQAIANMQSQRLNVGVRVVPSATPVDRQRTDAQEDLIRRLAEQHFRQGRKARNNALRALGFHPAGPAGDRYRAIFTELCRAARYETAERPAASQPDAA